MIENTTAKRVADSRVVLTVLMNPEHANPLGNVHGGVIMKLTDEAGGIAAMRHSRSAVVTVAVDSMTFEEPVYVGNLVTVAAELTYVGRTSMEVRVTVAAEDPLSGSTTHTNLAYLVYVAIDDNGRPQPVPRLISETPEETMRMQQGEERQALRKERHRREQSQLPNFKS
jgi:uncharacterized protein (TIGR00369 family)